MKKPSDVQERFDRALASLVERVQEDRNILAAIVFGSLSYDTVWDKSDIDLMLISQEHRSSTEKRGTLSNFALIEEDVNIHAFMQTRSEFKRMMEGTLRSSFMHSSFARSTLLFTRDETIRELYDNVNRLGARDRRVQLMHAASGVIPCLDKSEKFLRVKNDPRYAFLWISCAYSSLGQIEVYLHDGIAGREVVHQALDLNPEFFGSIYTELIDKKKTTKNVAAAIDAIDGYLEERVPELFGPLLDYLAEAEDARSSKEISSWFRREHDLHGVITVCEWLSEKEIIAKVATPVRLTPRSQVDLDELAFFYDPEMGP